jgi:hypothetical protein
LLLLDVGFEEGIRSTLLARFAPALPLSRSYSSRSEVLRDPGLLDDLTRPALSAAVAPLGRLFAMV